MVRDVSAWAIHTDPLKAFVGWSTKKGDASEIRSILTPTQNMTLYAIYSDGYEVTLESADSSKGRVEIRINGKWINSDDTGENTFIWPKGLTVGNVPYSVDSEEGYVFKGFSTSKDKKDVVSDSFVPSKNMTLYGIFVQGCYVVFYAGEGSYDNEMNGIDMTVETGDAIGNVQLPEAPEGKVFDGWMIWNEDRETWVDVPYDVASHVPRSYERYCAKYTEKTDTINLHEAEISLVSTVKYTGKALTPAVTVK